MAKINFSEVEEGYPLWPEDVYPARLEKVELVKAKSGHCMFKLRFEPESQEVKGYAFYQASLHPNALWNTKQTLQRIGLEPQVWEECGDMDSEDESTLEVLLGYVENLIGEEVSLVIIQEDYDPGDGSGTRMQNRVEKILSAGVASLAF